MEAVTTGIVIKRAELREVIKQLIKDKFPNLLDANYGDFLNLGFQPIFYYFKGYDCHVIYYNQREALKKRFNLIFGVK